MKEKSDNFSILTYFKHNDLTSSFEDISKLITIRSFIVSFNNIRHKNLLILIIFYLTALLTFHCFTIKKGGKVNKLLRQNKKLFGIYFKTSPSL
jgi:hypothetical protein